MTTFTLEGWVEKLAPHDAQGSDRLLYHQMRTREELRSHPIVLNTYNTGTGKTRAAHQRLIDLDGSGVNVLIIAPTNELIGQHVRDAAAFIKEHGLNYTVQAVTALDLQALQTGLRKGETLQRLLQNPREFRTELGALRQTVVVTNPDIFYLGLYMRYSAYDRRNVFAALQGFDYIIIDEFHYYSSKQAAVFLFALTMFDAFGYFSERTRRLCLLSATPRSSIIDALSRLFGDRLETVSPDNEPEKSAAYDTVPTLAPLHVTIQAVDLTEWVTNHVTQIEQWVGQEGLDGAIISGSLARINTIYASLRHMGDAVRRLTGPEPSAARGLAVQARLILATPTVDLGYNFIKLGKPHRQNLDFVICEAQYWDELVQRIGRAGRVLGKERADIPSQAVVLINEDAAQTLRELDGQRLSRPAFTEHLRALEALPAKHRLDDYQQRYALQEAAYPLHQLSYMLTEADQSILKETFERFKRIVAPTSPYTLSKFQANYRHYERRQRWLVDLRNHERAPDEPPKHTATMIADWGESWDEKRPDESAIESRLLYIWRKSEAEIKAFVESQIKLTDALFQFRDSFEGPSIAFYDPQHWFSSELIGVYNAIHVLSHYQVRLLENRAELERYSSGVPTADFYGVLEAQRHPPISLYFTLKTALDQQTFRQRWTGHPVALRGIGLMPSDAVPSQINGWMQEQIYVCLIIPPEGNLEARVRGRLRHSPLWARRLSVIYVEDDPLKAHEGYLIFLGNAAFEAHAALSGLLHAYARASGDPIII